MTARGPRARGGGLALVVCAGLLASSPRAGVGAEASPPLDVTVSCERKATPGRVLCDVEIEVGRGRISWADVVVVAAPPFAPPLRSRVALGDERARSERRLRIPVAFVAKAQGRGTVALRGRAVVCLPRAGAETCVPASQDVQTELVVGTDVVR